ncbi:hypothetical protein PAMC26577_23710 [Caballeronia sordidicola]|uniref:Uncharacterized protein n=1 Tax=Caballeronia sordidicola TaxID=196367 RepID=A0A242MJX4_CABSO|nr:hypothetical protein PAMC26577_23710 [Caballeronia sordidicola]
MPCAIIRRALNYLQEVSETRILWMVFVPGFTVSFPVFG